MLNRRARVLFTDRGSRRPSPICNRPGAAAGDRVDDPEYVGPGERPGSRYEAFRRSAFVWQGPADEWDASLSYTSGTTGSENVVFTIAAPFNATSNIVSGVPPQR